MFVLSNGGAKTEGLNGIAEQHGHKASGAGFFIALDEQLKAVKRPKAACFMSMNLVSCSCLRLSAKRSASARAKATHLYWRTIKAQTTLWVRAGVAAPKYYKASWQVNIRRVGVVVLVGLVSFGWSSDMSVGVKLVGLVSKVSISVCTQHFVVFVFWCDILSCLKDY